MFFRNATNKSTGNYSDELARLKRELETADAVLIGAGSGLSTAAGFTYAGERFQQYFGDFAEKYGIQDIYSGGFYPFERPEIFWAWWSRHIWYNRYVDPPKPVYARLLELVRDRDYFVLTTNVDHQFQNAGFDKARLFYTQGDYGLFQCSLPCRQETYDNKEAVRAMLDAQSGMEVPTDLLPRCPHCGRPMVPNLRSDDTFVEDAGWHAAAERYRAFLERQDGRHVLFLELGVGGNTPVIIKYPFWRLTAANPKAVYACLNRGEAVCPKEIRKQSICIDGDIGEILERL